MRQRIVIGLLLAFPLIGSVWFVLAQPREGSPEWHAREYESIVRQIEGRTIRYRCAKWWAKFRGARVPPPVTLNQRKELTRELKKQQRAIIECGYLLERRFSITNYDARVLEAKMWRKWNALVPTNRVYHTWLAGARGNDIMVVVGQPQDFPLWERAIREADVPETGK